MNQDVTLFSYAEVGPPPFGNICWAALAYDTKIITDIEWRNNHDTIPHILSEDPEYYSHAIFSYTNWYQGYSDAKYGMVTDTNIKNYYILPFEIILNISTFYQTYEKSAWKKANLTSNIVGRDIQDCWCLELNSLGIILFEESGVLKMQVDSRYASYSQVKITYLRKITDNQIFNADVERMAFGVYKFNLPSGQTNLDNVGGFTNILLLGDETSSLLAARYLGELIPFYQGGEVNSVWLRVTSTRDSASETHLETAYVLDYNEHIKNTAQNPDLEHPTFKSSGQALLKNNYSNGNNLTCVYNSDYISRNNFMYANSITASDPFNPEVQQINVGTFGEQKFSFCAGKGYNLSSEMWFYWDYQTLNETIRRKFPNESIILTDPQSQIPQIGFSSRNGCFVYNLLYLNYENKDYIILCMAGCNTYKVADVLIAEMPGELKADLELENGVYCFQTWGGSNQDQQMLHLRTKINKFYNSYYFVYKGKAYYLKYNYSDGSGATKEIKYQVVDGIQSGKPYNAFKYLLGYFPNCTCERFLQEYDHLYMPEFSDLGDILISCTKTDSGCLDQNLQFISVLDPDLYEDENVQVANVNDLHALDSILNRYYIDHNKRQTILKAMYYYAAHGTYYLLKNGYSPIVIDNSYVIGYNQDIECYIYFQAGTSYRKRLLNNLHNDRIRGFSGNYIFDEPYYVSLLNPTDGNESTARYKLQGAHNCCRGVFIKSVFPTDARQDSSKPIGLYRSLAKNEN